MNKIQFKSTVAQRIYDDYMYRVQKSLDSLSESDRNEMIMEINSHIFEGTVQCAEDQKEARLLDVLGKLGLPEEFLIPLIARKKLNQAIRTFHPRDVFIALRLNLKNGLKYSVFALLYLFLISFAGIIVAKLISPTHTGLFYNGDSFQGFGFISDTAGCTEVLGFWLIPLSIIVACLLYTCITLLLRITSR